MDERGFEGKIAAAQYTRENKIPTFGICLGLQVIICEFARNVLGFEKANSTEMDKQTPYPVISLLEEQREVEAMGGTMRLGAFNCKIEPNTLAFKAYGNELISERHRHRYEVNNKYLSSLEEKGMIFSGKFAEQNLCEIAEIKEHPWMLGCQFHPEFKSKPTQAHPLFKSFIQALIDARAKCDI